MYSLDDYGEQSICQARASVMVYDDTSKKWVPIKPGQQGFSRINIYHNTANNTFRVVGVKLQDQQVVINYSIVKGLKYNQATPTFHQWRDARQVYGLNFASKEEATTFSNAMLFALNVLSSQEAGPAAVHRQNGPVTDDSDAQRRQMMEQHQMQAQMERDRRAAGSAGPPLPPGHPAMQHQSSMAAPVLPPPAPALAPAPAPMAPPPPPGPPPPIAGAPPTPPPLPASGGPGGQSKEAPPAGLAAALAGAKLRKVQRSEEASGPAGVKNDGNRSSGGSGGSGEGLMQEMNAILARRRKASEKPDEDGQKEETNGSSPITRGSSQQNSTDPVKKPWDRANSTDKSSAVSRVKPVGTSSDGDATEYDRMKQEILEEVVRELHKVKDEIIDAIRREVTRLSST
ncbi:enah/Vasp-like a isoform X7 [Sardina pilchardus]|uniref:enah/Vasp-like a isoform X7 n=1 Tax=Sardina pilchardus TaxID=27697 RepID=UPI002E0F544C